MPMTDKELEEIAKSYQAKTDKNAKPSAEVASPEDKDGFIMESLKDLGISGAEGFSFGQAKKALSYYQALQEASNPEEFDSLYQQKLKENEEALERIKERSPIMYWTGEIGGGLLNPLPGGLAKGAATALGLTKAASAIAELSPVLGKAAQGTAEGALMGGGLSALDSEKEGKDLISDIVQGAKFGGLTGGALSGTGGLAKKAWESLKKESPTAQKAARAFELEKEGLGPEPLKPGRSFSDETPTELKSEPISLGSTSGMSKLIGELQNTAKRVSDSAIKLFDHSINQYQQFFEKNAKVPLSVNDEVIGNDINQILTAINNNKEELKKALGSNFIRELTQTSSPFLTPQYGDVNAGQLNSLRRELIKNLDKIEDIDVKNMLVGENGLIKAIEKTLTKKFPEFSTLKNNIDIAARPAERLMEEELMADPNLPKKSRIFLSDLDPDVARSKLEKVVKDLSKRYYTGGISSAEERKLFEQFLQNYENSLNELSNKQITAKDELGDLLAKALGSELKKTGISKGEDAFVARSRLLREAGAESPEALKRAVETSGGNIGALIATAGWRPENDKALLSVMPLLKGKVGAGLLGFPAIKGAQYAGKIAGSAPVKGFKALQQLPINQLKAIANQLSSSESPYISNIGRSAAEGLEQSGMGRAIFLHQIFTNPDIRKELGLTVNDEGKFESKPEYSEEEQRKAVLEEMSKKGM